MQVACTHCGAQYEFDASAIPAAGYDAQCTTCNGVFFVGPQAPVNEQVSVACSTCGAVYQFSPDQIPAAGYDAQCTQCQSVFFVGPQTVSAATTAELEVDASQAPVDLVTAEPDDIPEAAADDFLSMSQVVQNPLYEPAPEDSPKSQEVTTRGFAPEALHHGTMELDADGVPSQASDAGDFTDVLTMNAELGEPMGDPTDAKAEAEIEAIVKRRSRRMWVGGAISLGLLLVVGLLFVAAPRAFDVTVGRIFGIKRTINPDAVASFERGRTLMLDDTDEAYANASKELAQALKIDPLYAEALAYNAVCNAWRGTDLQAQGQQSVAMGQKEQARAQGYAALLGRGNTAVVAAKVAELQKSAKTHIEAGTDMLETGGRYISIGLELLLRGKRTFPKSPAIAEATALCAIVTQEPPSKADKALARSAELRYGAKTSKKKTTGPPNAWVPFIQGLLHAAERGGAESAAESFTSALKLEPSFQRARWELAQLFMRVGQPEEARHTLHDLLTAVPDHVKAKSLQALIVAQQAALVAAKTPPPSDVKVTKKRRGGARRR